MKSSSLILLTVTTFFIPISVYAKKFDLSNFKMINIPAGSFNMGSTHANDSARPIHVVNVSGFKMMEAEVTWALYQQCIDMNACLDNDEFGGDEGWGKKNRPVINVSYEDITKHFIPWLNNQTGAVFKLPTEAQWEYAARAGSKTKFSWGDEIDCTMANYDDNNNECTEILIENKNKVVLGTRPVKSYLPNAFGLYDMHGNVWEWTQDCWNKNYEGAPVNGEAWLEGNCNFRQVRGGAWVDPEKYLRSGDRNRNWIKTRIKMVGFRLVQDILLHDDT